MSIMYTRLFYTYLCYHIYGSFNDQLNYLCFYAQRLSFHHVAIVFISWFLEIAEEAELGVQETYENETEL